MACILPVFLGQLVHATELISGRNIIGNGVVLFHGDLLAVAFRQNDIQKPVDIIGTTDLTAGASEIKGNDVLTPNATLNHEPLAILHVKQWSVLFDGAKFGIGKISNQFGFSMDTGSGRHNILQNRINHLDSISQQHRMMEIKQ